MRFLKFLTGGGALQVILIPVAIAVIAFIIIFTFLDRARSGLEAQVSLTRLEEYSVHLDAEEWHAIADPPYTGEASRNIQVYESEIDSIFAGLDAAYPGDANIERVRESYVEYREALEQEFALLEAGNTAEAREVDESLVDPRYEELEETIVIAAGELAAMTDRDEAIAVTGSFVTAIVGAVLIGFLFWRYDVARQHNVQSETEKAVFRTMSLVDDLTGLYNRRGFINLAQQQLKTATREGRKALIVFADLDGMKWINDNLGHVAGDTALRDVAAILRKTFRESDIVARLGGDEFVVLALETPVADAERPLSRLQRHLDDYNLDSRYGSRPRLSLSTGLTVFDPERPRGIDELIAEADKLMYRQKKTRGADAHLRGA